MTRKPHTLHTIATRRRAGQSGNEIIEFGLMMLMLTPIMFGSFVLGMNLIKSNTTNSLASQIGDMYIHGGDFTTYPMQQMTQRMATGMNLQIGSSFTGNNRNNTGNTTGDGRVVTAQIMYIGGTTSASCQAVVSPATCVNHDSFVYLEYCEFGNSAVTFNSTIGPPNSSINIASAGKVSNWVTDSNAKLQTGPQSAMAGIWQVTGTDRAPLVDQQVIYVVETFFRTPSLTLGVSSPGIYSRSFH